MTGTLCLRSLRPAGKAQNPRTGRLLFTNIHYSLFCHEQAYCLPVKFLTYDIWRITEDEVTKTTYSVYNIIKTVYLCITRFSKDRVANKAAALTYSTLLAIVPILAILFAIARGFGFDNLMKARWPKDWADRPRPRKSCSSLSIHTFRRPRAGFSSASPVMLLWSVINLVNNMEITFNRIWQVQKARSMYRKITDYFSMLLLLPLLIVVSGGLSLFMSTTIKHMEDFTLLAPIGKFLVNLIPYVLTWCMFTGLYIFMPNTKVKLKHALISGILAGTAYQAFQFLYIHSQLWVSRYNAIYGSFAALPLFLLWVQISWTICLFGVELTYADKTSASSASMPTRAMPATGTGSSSPSSSCPSSPNVLKERAALHCPRAVGGIPHSYPAHPADPLRTTGNQSAARGCPRREKRGHGVPALYGYRETECGRPAGPADSRGSENFKVDTETRFNDEWDVLMKAKEEYYKSAGQCC